MNDKKRLRSGFTTGTCAAAAAGYAARALLLQKLSPLEEVKVLTPKGKVVNVPVVEVEFQDTWARCAVQKDSGDDPDVTNGVWVHAKVSLTGKEGQISIDGGLGVGRVTKNGLACPVGQAAINPTPRKMIEEAVRKAMEDSDYQGGISVEISIPAGVELAKKTFNPRLGIEGGISVLGTSGVVEPMSEQALIDTIKVEINMKRAEGKEYLILTPGNYGEAFLKEKMNLPGNSSIKCSNFIGEALSYCNESRFSGILLVGHIGKLIKVAAGIMNTHSQYGDGRMETFVRHAKGQGASSNIIEELRSCVTTEDCIRILESQEVALIQPIMTSILKKIKEHMELQVGKSMTVEAMAYSNVYGCLGTSDGADALLNQIIKSEEGM